MVQVGDTLGEGRYEVEGVLGKGGMATVFRVRDTRLRIARALKILDPELSARAGLRKRFEVEAHAMAKLNHVNIVRVFDVVDDGSHFYIVMELIGGPSVLDLIDDGPMDLDKALSVSAGVLKALTAAHSAGIIHRDIKPHNLLLTEEGDVRVSDFGIAQCADFAGRSVTRTGAVMGTWAFMAPEQRADAKGVDPGADIYSMGATLYAMVTGLTPPDLFAAEIDPAMYEDVPKPVREIIRRATRYWAWERYPSANSMREDLELMKERVSLGQAEGIDLRLKDDSSERAESAPMPVPAADLRGPVVEPDEPLPAGRATTRTSPSSRRTSPPKPAPKKSHTVWIVAGVVVCIVGAWLLSEPMRGRGERVSTETKRPEIPVFVAPAVQEGVETLKKPALEHTPPEEVVLDEQVELRARVLGSRSYDQVTAYYRPAGEEAYRQTRLTRAGEKFRGYLPVDRSMKGGLEYYIEAKSYATGMTPLLSTDPGQPHRLVPRP